MPATDSLIEGSGTSRSTVEICEHFIHGVAVGRLIPPYSTALFGFPFSIFCAVKKFKISNFHEVTHTT
jgi:hypothetical protein